MNVKKTKLAAGEEKVRGLVHGYIPIAIFLTGGFKIINCSFNFDRATVLGRGFSLLSFFLACLLCPKLAAGILRHKHHLLIFKLHTELA